MAPKKKLKNTDSLGRIVLYKNRLEVRLEQDSVWLNLNQLAELFGRDKSVISRHLRNIFQTNELSRQATVAIFATVQSEGGRAVERQIEYFNLDVIISVGYRVNSKQGTRFRIWATGLLRRHLVDGFTLNEKRLRTVEGKYRELQQILTLLNNVKQLEGVSDETRGLVEVVTAYGRALDLLDDYDHERLMVPKGTLKARYTMTYEKALDIINEMSRMFHDSALFGQEKDLGLKSTLGEGWQDTCFSCRRSVAFS